MSCARIAGGNHRNCKNRRSRSPNRYFIVFYMCFLTTYLLRTYSTWLHVQYHRVVYSFMSVLLLSCMYFSNLKKLQKQDEPFPQPGQNNSGVRVFPRTFFPLHIHPREFPRFHSLRTYSTYVMSVDSVDDTYSGCLFYVVLQLATLLASFHSNFPRFAQFHNF